MKNIRSILLIITSLLYACSNPNQEQHASEQNPTLSSNDTNIVKKSPDKMNEEDRVMFFTNAAIGGMMEVEASSKVLQQANSNPTVIAHAKIIKNDHIKANATLKLIAQQHKFILPATLPESKLKLLKQMESLNDEAQNEFYINLMITEHNEAITLFNLAVSMDDEAISSFASKTLPILKHHYEMTVAIKNKMNSEKKNQGDDVLKLSDKQKNNPAKNQN